MYKSVYNPGCKRMVLWPEGCPAWLSLSPDRPRVSAKIRQERGVLPGQGLRSAHGLARGEGLSISFCRPHLADTRQRPGSGSVAIEIYPARSRPGAGAADGPGHSVSPQWEARSSRGQRALPLPGAGAPGSLSCKSAQSGAGGWSAGSGAFEKKFGYKKPGEGDSSPVQSSAGTASAQSSIASRMLSSR